ncbi:pyruvate kinase [Kocuria rhizophila]|nr:pyruvate kinase [Kocuria rhizophila]
MATIGPAISSSGTSPGDPASINVARLNMSHGDHSVHSASYENIRRASGTRRHGGDPRGPCSPSPPRAAPDSHTAGDRGDTLRSPSRDVPGTGRSAPPHKGLPGDVSVGEPLLIDDGKVALRATGSRTRTSPPRWSWPDRSPTTRASTCRAWP